MFDSTRSFLRRHSTSLFFGAGAIGAGYLAVQYVGSKLSEAKTRMMSDRVARENIHRRFQQNQEDCTFTVLALLPTATENIVKELPVEKLTAELQKKKAARIAKSSAASGTDVGSETATGAEEDTQSMRSFASESFTVVTENAGEKAPRKSKIQLWEEIKITSLTRSFTLLYTLSLLTLLTRVQLNLLGRKNYLSSVLSLAERDNDPTIRLESHEDPTSAGGAGIDMETNRQYLTFSWWLLHRGWQLLSPRVEAATKEAFGNLTPRDTISLNQFRALALQVRQKVEAHEKETHWLPYLLPPREEEPMVLTESGTLDPNAPPQTPSPELRRLLDETSDLIESPGAAQVLARMCDVGYEVLIDDKLSALAFRAQGKLAVVSEEKPRIEEIVGEENDETATTKFASVLAALARQAHVIGNGASNEYLKVMETHTELDAFSALVYSSNFEFAVQAGAEEKPRVR